MKIGQLGHGVEKDEVTPRLVTFPGNSRSPTKIKLISCGAFHTVCAAENKIFTFGLGIQGTLGHGNNLDSSVPMGIERLDGMEIRNIDCGDSETVVVTSTGDTYVWGGDFAEKSEDSDNLIPKLLKTPEKFVQVACGAHVCYGWTGNK